MSLRGSPSIRLTHVLVGTILVSRKPAFSKSTRYSASVLSMPPGPTIIAKSKNLLTDGSFP